MTEHTDPSDAARPRRAGGVLGTVLSIAVALVVGWLLWPTSLGGLTTLTIVSGESMEPTYSTGDLVVARAGQVEVGDVVVYTPPDVGGARVIHRVVDGDGTDGWVAQGDNNAFLDPWRPTDDDVLGRAVLHLPGAGHVAALALSPLTWVSLLLVAGALLLWPGDPPRHRAEPASEAPQELDDRVLTSTHPTDPHHPSDREDPT